MIVKKAVTKALNINFDVPWAINLLSARPTHDRFIVRGLDQEIRAPHRHDENAPR
jgi:hypothetical protein